MRKGWLLCLLLMAASCANRVAPTGGEKDTTPPKLLEAVPSENSLHFSAKEIRLKFDEYVTLNDLQNQLMISPLTPKQPVVKVGKRELIIEMPDSLQPNTTYTLSFGKAIVDVHESNPLADFKYVFSTGDYLDSLSLSGEVKEAAVLAGSKGVTVLVYRKKNTSEDDSLPFKSRPSYFSRTNDKGMFRISNMAAGEYYVYAVEDKNNNYFCDRPWEEPFGFLGRSVKLPGDSILWLKTALEYPAQVRMTKTSRVDRRAIQAYFNQPDIPLQLRDFAGNVLPPEQLWWSATHDTVTIFDLKGEDSLRLVALQGEKIIDSLQVRLIPEPGVKAPELMNRYKILSSPQDLGPSAPVMMQSQHPLQAGSGEIFLQEDSSKMIALRFQVTEPGKGVFSISYPWKEGANYKLMLPPGQINDIFEAKTDTARFSFRVPDEKSTSTLTLKIEGLSPSGRYILQLVTEKMEVLKEIVLPSDTSVTFKYLQATGIRIRIINDLNRDGHWTPGQYSLKRQPEPVYVHPDKLNLRANWELETVISPEFE